MPNRDDEDDLVHGDLGDLFHDGDGRTRRVLFDGAGGRTDLPDDNVRGLA
jgi:hypothetical protein